MDSLDFSKDNFILIAENTTKYYIELNNNYADRFINRSSLLAAAGVLDAQNYLFTDDSEIDISSICESTKNIVQDAKLNEEQALISFKTWLEIQLFKVDNPGIPYPDIVEAVDSKMDNIVKVIRDTKEQYEEEPLFSEATTTFMEAHQLKEIREKLGTKG